MRRGRREVRAVTVVVGLLAVSALVIPYFPTVEAGVTAVFAALLALELGYGIWIVVRDLYL